MLAFPDIFVLNILGGTYSNMNYNQREQRGGRGGFRGGRGGNRGGGGGNMSNGYSRGGRGITFREFFLFIL